jgi:hypothetical protein
VSIHLIGILGLNRNIADANDNCMRFVAEMETYEFFMAFVEHYTASESFPMSKGTLAQFMRRYHLS